MRRTILLCALFLAAPAFAAESPRVGTLLPYVADALREIPGSRVVASVRRSMAEPPPAGVADLGSSHSPNLERLAASRADLVIADERLHKALQPKVRAAGAEAFFVRGDSVDGTLEGLLQVGRRIGVEKEMSARIGRTRSALSSVALRRPVSTLVLFGAPGSFLVVTPETWLGDLLGKLGFRNVATASLGKETVPGYLALNEEVIASLQPDLVLLVTHGNPKEMEQAFQRMTREKSAWRGLDDARLGVHVLAPGLFAANPGLRMEEAARHLVGLVNRAR
jgi:iron complex transport system substrate-binding protein